MILVALGSNMTGPWGTPHQTVTRALAELNTFPLRLKAASTLLVTKPFGVLNQPDFVNAAAWIETALPPETLLRKLHEIEKRAGRKRRRRWGPRTLDLDLLDYNGQIKRKPSDMPKALILPHPGLAARRFVLEPVAEIAPRWKHPQRHLSPAQLLAHLPH
ncbi:2-amino-4-hydroxy-6-hydroxymethyldihydropteridine diphosphokinase [Aestuariivirga litoralis]|uniref:2-amino-4-hydroxy-6- hydroxymethyldihydropteridine diphosphokinase n=1 Tax=Aestuariivirga litoralis TaxID=2650924 RepID=UPI0018C7E8F7|nr:2-amino-4-hydroxy-6-hydroxymethyldihydropteridine diphosphokinase [Aestuariivirga litoralis]MBG1231668.1 2-amino-4-hydroxy-6-hydroxymethyldihydropteridine diphosphokinase [Aestuariivirga litoralis]